jgi:alpha-glucosidase
VTDGTALDFALGGVWSRLTGRFAVDHDTYGSGSVVFRIRGDGRALVERRSASIQDPPAALDVDVSGIRVLTLEVDRGTGTKPDFCDWFELKLAR